MKEAEGHAAIKCSCACAGALGHVDVTTRTFLDIFTITSSYLCVSSFRVDSLSYNLHSIKINIFKIYSLVSSNKFV